MRRLWNDPSGKSHERIEGDLYVPNSYVNDDGKPNLNNSNARNDNHARVAVRYRRIFRIRFCAIHRSDGGHL